MGNDRNLCDGAVFGASFSTYWNTLFDLGSLTRVKYPKCTYGP